MFPRLDRIATLHFFHPLRRLIPSNEGLHIPILMYHGISEREENGIHPYYRVNTTPEIFAEHIRYLHENNYSVISLKQAANLLTNQPINQATQSTSQPINYAVITFDDGFRDFYTQAFPILQKYSYTATVFLPTKFIDNKGLKLTGKAHLSWNEVRELNGNGINFGSHTVTHPQLKLLKGEDVECEIRHSKETIEDKLGEPIESFSYPYAFPDEDRKFVIWLKNILSKWGYKYGVSTRIGVTTKKDDIYFIKRIPVNSCDDMFLLEAKLEGGYDWLNKPQNLYKILKRKIAK